MVIRNKELLVAIRPMGDVLVMSTMLFADEVLPPDRLEELSDGAAAKTTKREVDIAKQLVGSLAGDFEPDKYRDAYREHARDRDRYAPMRGDVVDALPLPDSQAEYEELALAVDRAVRTKLIREISAKDATRPVPA